jgi:hypothetical protein
MAQEGPGPLPLPVQTTPTGFLSITPKNGLHPFHIFNLLSSS